MANFSNVPPRRKVPKIKMDYQKHYAQLRSQFLDIIEEEGTIGQAHLKIKLGWGDGVYNRRKAEVLELFPGFINWNSKTKIFTWLKAEIDQPLTEKEIEKGV